MSEPKANDEGKCENQARCQEAVNLSIDCHQMHYHESSKVSIHIFTMYIECQIIEPMQCRQEAVHLSIGCHQVIIDFINMK